MFEHIALDSVVVWGLVGIQMGNELSSSDIIASSVLFWLTLNFYSTILVFGHLLRFKVYNHLTLVTYGYRSITVT